MLRLKELIDYSNCGNAGLLMSPFVTPLTATLRDSLMATPRVAAADSEKLLRQVGREGANAAEVGGGQEKISGLIRMRGA